MYNDNDVILNTHNIIIGAIVVIIVYIVVFTIPEWIRKYKNNHL